MNNFSCNLIELVVLTIPKTQKNENVASREKKKCNRRIDYTFR